MAKNKIWDLEEKLAVATETFLGRELTPDLLESALLTLIPLKVNEFYIKELQEQFSGVIEEINSPSKRIELAKDKEKVVKIARNLFELYRKVARIEYTEKAITLKDNPYLPQD
ncbi:MAG: hypothetical protein ABRQ37_15455 [Candidatus Eremiobacterota bacterium]